MSTSRYKTNPAGNIWAGILLDPLLTLLIIGALFWFMFRQAKTGVNQAFNFGRSNLSFRT